MAIIRLIFGLIFLLDTKVLCNRIPAQQENVGSLTLVALKKKIKDAITER